MKHLMFYDKSSINRLSSKTTCISSKSDYISSTKLKYYITSSQGASSKKLIPVIVQKLLLSILLWIAQFDSQIQNNTPENNLHWKLCMVMFYWGLGICRDIQQSAWHSYYWCLRTICNNLSTINYYSGSHLHKIVNGLQVIQVVIMHIHTETEVQSSITTIHNLEIAKLKPENTYCS